MEIRPEQASARVPVTILHVTGDIDVNTYEQLQAAAHSAYDAGARHVLLDLSGVPYISSAGVRALNHIFYLYRKDVPSESDEAIRPGLAAGTFHSALVKLLQPTRRVDDVLRLAGVDMFLEIHTDRDTALGSF